MSDSTLTEKSPRVARLYLRASTNEQDTNRQNAVIEEAKQAGFYIAAIYRENASGARRDRPELQRLIDELQPGDFVVAESMERISRLEYDQALALIEEVRNKKCHFWLANMFDFTKMIEQTQSGTLERILYELMNEFFIRQALIAAREDYEQRRKRQKQGIELRKARGGYKGKQPDRAKHELIITLRQQGKSIHETAKMVKCHPATVCRVWSQYKKSSKKHS